VLHIYIYIYIYIYDISHLRVKFRIAMAKAAFSEEKNLFTSKLYFNLRKKPVKYLIWSTALCGAETGTLRKIDQEMHGKF